MGQVIEWLQKYLDRLTIISKDHCKKWDMDRFHYIIEIGKERFDYYGSNRDYEIEEASKLWIYSYEKLVSQKDKSDFRKKSREEKDNDVKMNALYCLINDDFDWDMTEFVCEFWYNKDEKSLREWEQIYHQVKLNQDKLRRVFTYAEREELRNLYQDF